MARSAGDKASHPPISRISGMEFVSMFSFVIESTPIAIGVNPLVRTGREDAWLAPPLAMLVLFALLLPLFRLFHAYGERLFAREADSLSRRLLSVPLILLLLLLLMFNTRVFSDLLHLVYLPNTPEPIICGVFLLTALYAVTKGIEVVGRMCLMVMGLKILAMTSLPIFAYDIFNWRHLTPMLERGPQPVMAAVLHPLSWFLEAALLALLWPLVQRARPKVLVAGCLIGLYNFYVPFLVAQLAFGAPLIARLLYPVLNFVQTMALGDFFERIDAVLVAVWTIAMICKVAVYLALLLVLLQRLLHVRLQGSLLYPLLLILIAFAPQMGESVGHYLHTYRLAWPVLSLVLLASLYLLGFSLRPSHRMRERSRGDSREVDLMTGGLDDGSAGNATQH